MTPVSICVDASIVVPLVTRAHQGSSTAERWQAWHEAGRLLAAPTLLYYEVANALRRYVTHQVLEPEEASDALDAALGLDIHLVGDAELHRRALAWAQRCSLAATYDAHYLAVAERLGAELWTGDRRLYLAVHSTLPWVHLVEEVAAGAR